MKWPTPSPEIKEEVEYMLKKHGMAAIRDVREKFKSIPASPPADRDMRQMVASRLSRYITYGIIQLSIEQMKATDDFRESLRDEKEPYTVVLHRLMPLVLPEYVPRISFALRAGATELWRMDSAFAVRGLVGLRDTRLTFHEKKLQEYKFGSLKGAISIYMKGEEIQDILHSFDRDLTFPGFMAGDGE